jgi:DNA-binding response OmpR family regulator
MTKRILVVEDQEDLRGILRDLFTRSGYVVLEAADGATGVALSALDQLFQYVLCECCARCIDVGVDCAADSR